jgi:hypothetical protein
MEAMERYGDLCSVVYFILAINIINFFFFVLFSKHCHNRGYAVGELDQIPEGIFKKMFHVDQATFDELLEKITPIMVQRGKQNAINSSGSSIHPSQDPSSCDAKVACWWFPYRLIICLGKLSILYCTVTEYYFGKVAIDEAYYIGFPIDNINKLI